MNIGSAYGGNPVNCGAAGSTVRNNGPDTVYYRDEYPSGSSTNDGAIASGSSAILYGTQWLFSSGSANVTLTTRAASAESGSDDGRRIAAAPIGSGGLDTATIADAISAASAAGGKQCIQLQPGIYSVDPDQLTVTFDNLLIAGMGAGVTQIEKTGNGDLLLIQPTGLDGSVIQRVQTRDLRLDGNDFTGALIRSRYGSQCHVKGVEFASNNDVAYDIVRGWDTLVDDVFFDFCGKTDGTVPALWIRNSAAASGAGFSAGQTNMITVRGGRIESCRRALNIERGTGSSIDPYGIYFHGLKCETSFARGSEHIKVSNVRHITFRDLDVTINALDSGASAIEIIDFAPLRQAIISGARFRPAASTVTKCIDLWLPSTGTYEVVAQCENAAPTTAVVNWNNQNMPQILAVTAETGTVHGGSTPWGTAVASAATITVPANNEFVQVSGTTTITSVAAAAAGRKVTLLFQGALTFTDGSNLKLNGNFVTTADDTITLVSDGTNWIEVARSAN